MFQGAMTGVNMLKSGQGRIGSRREVRIEMGVVVRLLLFLIHRFIGTKGQRRESLGDSFDGGSHDAVELN